MRGQTQAYTRGVQNWQSFPLQPSRISMAKGEFNRKKTLFTSKMDINLRQKLAKCCIWSTALYGAETWTLVQVLYQKYLDTFDIWCWRKMEKTSCTDRVRNEEVLHTNNKERNILHTIKIYYIQYPAYNKNKAG